MASCARYSLAAMMQISLLRANFALFESMILRGVVYSSALEQAEEKTKLGSSACLKKFLLFRALINNVEW